MSSPLGSVPQGFEGTLTWRNSQATIRHLRLDQPLHYGTILKQPLGLFRGGTYNDIQIRHDFEASNTNQNKAYWMASTSMNALYEYNDYASINHENIGQTPSALDILITSANNGGAAAPMLGKLKQAGYAYLTEVDITLGGSVNISMSLFLGAYVGLWSQLVTHFINRHLAAYPPDVVLNYGAYRSTTTTDNIKETMYHEYAHVGHYAGLPSSTRDAYWAANIDYIVANTTSGNIMRPMVHKMEV